MVSRIQVPIELHRNQLRNTQLIDHPGDEIIEMSYQPRTNKRLFDQLRIQQQVQVLKQQGVKTNEIAARIGLKPNYVLRVLQGLNTVRDTVASAPAGRSHRTGSLERRMATAALLAKPSTSQIPFTDSNMQGVGAGGSDTGSTSLAVTPSHDLDPGPSTQISGIMQQRQGNPSHNPSKRPINCKTSSRGSSVSGNRSAAASLGRSQLKKSLSALKEKPQRQREIIDLTKYDYTREEVQSYRKKKSATAPKETQASQRQHKSRKAVVIDVYDSPDEDEPPEESSEDTTLRRRRTSSEVVELNCGSFHACVVDPSRAAHCANTLTKYKRLLRRSEEPSSTSWRLPDPDSDGDQEVSGPPDLYRPEDMSEAGDSELDDSAFPRRISSFPEPIIHAATENRDSSGPSEFTNTPPWPNLPRRLSPHNQSISQGEVINTPLPRLNLPRRLSPHDQSISCGSVSDIDDDKEESLQPVPEVDNDVVARSGPEEDVNHLAIRLVSLSVEPTKRIYRNSALLSCADGDEGARAEVARLSVSTLPRFTFTKRFSSPLQQSRDCMEGEPDSATKAATLVKAEPVTPKLAAGCSLETSQRAYSTPKNSAFGAPRIPSWNRKFDDDDDHGVTDTSPLSLEAYGSHSPKLMPVSQPDTAAFAHININEPTISKGFSRKRHVPPDHSDSEKEYRPSAKRSALLLPSPETPSRSNAMGLGKGHGDDELSELESSRVLRAIPSPSRIPGIGIAERNVLPERGTSSKQVIGLYTPPHTPEVFRQTGRRNAPERQRPQPRNKWIGQARNSNEIHDGSRTSSSRDSHMSKQYPEVAAFLSSLYPSQISALPVLVGAGIRTAADLDGFADAVQHSEVREMLQTQFMQVGTVSLIGWSILWAGLIARAAAAEGSSVY